jgi:hypothetical protein
MIAFGGPGWLEDAAPRRSVGVSPSPKNSLSTMMGSIIQGATSSRPHPRILIGCGPRGPGMFRAVMTDPGRMRCGCRPGGVEPYPFDRGLLIEDAGTERGWRYEGRGPFCIRFDPSRSSRNLCSTNERTKRATSPESETLFFSCLLLSKTPGVVSLELYLLLSIESSDITPRVTAMLVSRLINHPGDSLADSRWSLAGCDARCSMGRLWRGDFGDANTSFECNRGAMVVRSRQVVVDRVGFA